MKIYTKAGDKGDTKLFDGTQVRKDDPRVDAYGEVDELNATLGAAAAFLEDPELKSILYDVQRDLFSIGAALADPRHKGSKEKSRLNPARVTVLEQSIDRFETELPALRQFILAGGSPAGALLHVARTVCRRAERRVVAIKDSADVDPVVVEYMNRLSDFLFVLARLVNQREDQQEIPW